MFKPKDQIVYIPNHADGDITHPGCELGFVTSVTDDAVYCRFFYDNGELRTKSCSERCYYHNIKPHHHTSQHTIDNLYERYCA